MTKNVDEVCECMWTHNGRKPNDQNVVLFKKKQIWTLIEQNLRGF